MTATARPVIGICAVRERARWAFWNQDAHLVADVIGGADIDPASYRAPRDPATESTYPERDEFEILMSVDAIERGLPLLGWRRTA